MQASLTLPNELPLRRDCFDGFAFRDRVTNLTFQCREARQDSPNANPAPSPAVTDSLNVYRFAKTFEKHCLRSKYLRHASPRKAVEQDGEKNGRGRQEQCGRRAVSK
jgi:hypothetical protein